jgi:hypothetical protein
MSVARKGGAVTPANHESLAAERDDLTLSRLSDNGRRPTSCSREFVLAHALGLETLWGCPWGKRMWCGNVTLDRTKCIMKDETGPRRVLPWGAEG